MTLTRSFVQNAATTPLDARLMNMAGLVCNADGSPRVGVIGGANTSIVSTLATMNVAIAAAEFATSRGKADGVSIFTNNGTVNVAIAAAPVSNSRIDVIWVKHNDDTQGDADALPVFGVTAGTAAASPTKPAIPTGALELATLRVYAGTTATNGGSNTLVNAYQMTAARGGVVTVRTDVGRDAWTNPVDGQLVYVDALGALFERVNSTVGWVHAAGKALVSALTMAGIYTAGTTRVVEQGGRISLEGEASSSTANFVAGTLYTLGSIPAAKAPIAARRFACTSNGTAVGSVIVDTTGAITFILDTSFGPGALGLSLAGCSWPDKRLG